MARIVALNATLRTELRTVAPALAQRAAPADQLDLMARLIEMAPTFGISNRSDGEWAALFGTYLDALAGIPLEAIDEAIMRWNRGEMYPEPKDKGRHAFFPKPVEIYTLAQPRRLELSKVAYRARKALEAPRVEARERGKPSEDDKARVAAMLAEVKAGVRGVPANPLGATPAEREAMFASRRRDPGAEPEEAV